MALTDGILAYWNLNDDGSGNVSLADATGNGYTLTNPYPVALGTGIIGGDAVFTGTSGEYLGPVDFGIQNSYSIGFWVKWGGPTGSSQLIYSSASNLGIQFLYNYNGNILVANYGTSPQSFDTGVPIPTDGNWHYYVITQASSGNFTVYLDATPVYTNTFTTGSALSGYLTGLGAESTDLSQTFNGQIDEVGTWNRALFPFEITSLYNGGIGLSYPFSESTDPNLPRNWDSMTTYSQGDVVSYSNSLWVLSSTSGWSVGGAPGSGYGWQKLSTGSGSSSSINLGALVGLPAFIQLS